jgi:hypothetical protein
MSLKKILVAFVLLDFTALSLFAVYKSGLSGLFALATDTGNWWGPVLAVDVCIALAIAMHWSWRDARAHGRTAWVATLLTPLGSIGPLTYLITRPDGADDVAGR